MIFDQLKDKRNEILKYIKIFGIVPTEIKNQNLLLQAFIHKSFAADYKNLTDHNERLEFIGDAILGAIISKLLYIQHPEMSEAELTLYKIALVREETLAKVAREIHLDKMLFLSKGEEKSEWRKKDVIISDWLEALIGYIYIDLWVEKTEKFITKYIYPQIKNIDTKHIKSYKTTIQEIVQKKYKIPPEYKDIENQIDSKWNTLEYRSEIYVLDKKKAEWFGPNKKKAQENAAQNYYWKINPNT